MGDALIPRISGSICLALLMEATLSRVSVHAHREGKSAPVTDQNTLEALFEIVKSLLINIKAISKTAALI